MSERSRSDRRDSGRRDRDRGGDGSHHDRSRDRAASRSYEPRGARQERHRHDRPRAERPRVVMPPFEVLPRAPPRGAATGVAVIVPFRDDITEDRRMQQLLQFAPHVLELLGGPASELPVRIFVVEQSADARLFNRGALLNAGYHLALQYERGAWPPKDLARHSWRARGEASAPPPGAESESAAAEAAATDPPPRFSHVILHDVDLLPSPGLKPFYEMCPASPLHIAHCWSRYSGVEGYFGGVVSFSISDYERINGYPNNYWGWGGEDDDMRVRVVEQRMCVLRPPQEVGQLTDLEGLDMSQKLQRLRGQKRKNPVQWELMAQTEATWRSNGLTNLEYAVQHVEPVGDPRCIKVRVHLGEYAIVQRDHAVSRPAGR